MPSRDANAAFLSALMDCQRSLYAYIWKLLPDTNDAKDVLQKTNLLLIEKQEEFGEIQNFGGWAARHAYFQVLAHRKTRQRDRHLFDDELVARLAEESQSDVSSTAPALRALGVCLERLPAADRDLVERRYRDKDPVKKLAAGLTRTGASVANSLYRIRRALLECIHRRLQAEGSK